VSNLNLRKGKHLTVENRIFIEFALDENYTLKEIAERLEKDTTTISKEVKINRVVSSTRKSSEFLRCKNYKDCLKKQLCGKSCNNLCKKCTMINCYRVCHVNIPQKNVRNSIDFLMFATDAYIILSVAVKGINTELKLLTQIIWTF
jgi:hypothetical protein